MADQLFVWSEPSKLVEQWMYQMEKTIMGKREPLRQLMIAVLAGGHVLIEDVPGVGKTSAVKALAQTLGLQFQRIQCTPDLLPSDIVGVSIYDPSIHQFTFHDGPIMTHILLADELNRTSPKTQSALLEAMEEKQVTVDGETYPLMAPFLVFATQNPMDYTGAFPLPEAQLDRFLMKIKFGYPNSIEEEIGILSRSLDDSDRAMRPQTILLQEELIHIQQQVRTVFVDERLKQFIVQFVVETRQMPETIRLGISPRATLAWMRAAQAYAWMQNRTFVIPDDVKYVMLSVLAHRIVLTPESIAAGDTSVSVLEQLMAKRTIPMIVPSKSWGRWKRA